MTRIIEHNKKIKEKKKKEKEIVERKGKDRKKEIE
jgi:hypothetical protein